MPKIKLNSIEFGEIPFRKLKGIKVDFADHITIISGHNGIGKSTILGLIANSSGYTQHSKAPKSYFGKTFQANLAEIIFIDYETEFLEAQEAESLPNPIIRYEINGREVFGKRCALADRSTEERARIVPRNSIPSSKAYTSEDGTIRIGEASKVPLPTLYLGMTRVLPLGEAEAGSVSNEVIASMDAQDRQTIADFVNGVIVGIDAQAASVTSNRIKGTSKFSSHPTYGYDAKCVSLGQDSLGSIAAAIASFQMLRREWSDYPGGLLIIDELDSGLHPHAISRLVAQLENYADALDLQIIATTHSTQLIEAVYPRARKPRNAVAYLMDTRSPFLMRDASLQNILDDMNLVPPSPAARLAKPELRIYLEDKEAVTLFNLLLPPAAKRALGERHGVRIKPIALGVGCDSLANLSLIDPHFRLSAFALDADASVRAKHRKHGNLILLHGSGRTSPERTLFSYVTDLVQHQGAHQYAWEALHAKRVTSDMLKTHLLNWEGDVSERKAAKKWWRERAKYFMDWKLLEAWMAENHDAVATFHQELEASVQVVSKRLRKLAKTGTTG